MLSNPQLVRLIESEFVPLLVHNNRPGRDAELLKRFKEPAWNYQVVRFLDSEGEDIIPRKDRVWTRQALAARMAAALRASGRPVPDELAKIN